MSAAFTNISTPTNKLVEPDCGQQSSAGVKKWVAFISKNYIAITKTFLVFKPSARSAVFSEYVSDL